MQTEIMMRRLYADAVSEQSFDFERPCVFKLSMCGVVCVLRYVWFYLG